MSEAAATTANGPTPRATVQGRDAALPPHELGVNPMAGVMDQRALPAPTVVKRGANSPAVRSMQQLTPEQLDAMKDKPQSRDFKIARRAAMDESLREILGTVVRNTTRLMKLDGTWLEELRGLDGRFVRWSLWAPGKGILIDREKPKPSDEELARRMEYAVVNEIRYAYVEPGAKVSPAEIQRWLDEIKEGARG